MCSGGVMSLTLQSCLKSISLSASTSACVSQMFLTVFLSNNDQHFTEVPITPETVCGDVLELCKEPGEASCHLAEVWRGSGESLEKNRAFLTLTSL